MFNDPAIKTAINATLHCLTGCAIGEMTGMIVGSLLGVNSVIMIIMSISFAFLFGYSFTSLPLLKSGMGLRSVLIIAFVADTFSIATMELADSTVLSVIPGALGASVSEPLFWISMSTSLFIAFLAAVPVNRYLINHGRSHAIMHTHHDNN